MPGRTHDVLARLHAPNPGDLRIHLRAGKMASQARFGTLAELDLDGPHRRRADDLDQAVEVEVAVRVAAPK